MPFTKEALDDIFSYHSPTPEQIPKYEVIREGARFFADIILRNTPVSPDQSVAIRKLRECVMVANSSIALDGKY